MTGTGLQSTFTSEFHQAFREETQSLLRRRFAQYGLIMVSVIGLFMLVDIADVITGWIQGELGEAWSDNAEGLVRRSLGVSWFGGMLACAWYGLLRREKLADLTVWTFVGYGVIVLVVTTFAMLDTAREQRVVPVSAATLLLVLAHVFACAILPWSPRQAVRPLLVLFPLTVVLSLIAPSALGVGLDMMIAPLSMLFAGPGLFVTWAKYGRRMENFRARFFQARYGQIRRELTDARRIHEGVFPQPVRDGRVRMDYRYEPMQQIGGDYLYAAAARSRDAERDALNLVLIDVTGHGVAAALTVNRLHGEVERLYAETPDAGPGDVLRALNRYVQLTLAPHSVYATALCVHVDPAREELCYASGGHPPAFVQAVDGTIDRLDSTAFVLGACSDADFDAGEQCHVFGAGDRLLAYTDGAIEARNADGRMWGIEGLERLLASEANAGLDLIMRQVEWFREGRSLDDVLVVEIVRTLASVRRTDANGARTRAGARA